MDTRLRAPHFVEEPQRPQAIGHPLGDRPIDAAPRREIGRGELGGKPLGDKTEQVRAVIESMPADDFAQNTVNGAKPAAPSTSGRVGDLDLGHGHQNDLEAQVRVIEQCGDADQLLEHIVDRPALRRLARLRPRPFEIGRNGDGMHEQDAKLRKEVVELLAHGGERARLYLDQEIAPANVDHEAVEGHLELIARLGVVVLERRVERSLVERADVWFDRDSLTLPSRP